MNNRATVSSEPGIQFCDATSHMRSNEEGLVNGQWKVSSWDHIEWLYPHLQNVHTAGEYANPSPDDLPPVECVFEFEVPNDALVLIDSSGSMSFQDPDLTGQDALDAAIDAALGIYNSTASGEFSGISTYADDLHSRVAYEAFDGTPLTRDDLGPAFGPVGCTDIEGAIKASADAIWASSDAAESGRIMLLSDGQPTGEFDATQNRCVGTDLWNKTLAAAEYACTGGAYPIAVNSLAFGDADVDLLAELSQTSCGEQSFVRLAGSNRRTTIVPSDVKTSFARLGYEVDGHREVLHEETLGAPLTDDPSCDVSGASPESDDCVFVREFVVPTGAEQLDVAWLGRNVGTILVPDSPLVSCPFESFDFRLLHNGVEHGTSPVGAAEADYGTKTLRVANPQPGTWRMELRQFETGTTDCRQMPLRFGWVANIVHGDLEPRVSVFPRVGPVNEPVTITAAIDYQQGRGRLTDLTVVAKVMRRGAAYAVALKDDGLGADDSADDGLYTGTFDLGAAGAPSPWNGGYYTVEVELTSTAGVSGAVANVQPGDTEVFADEVPPSGPPVVLAPPPTAVLRDEATFGKRSCCDPNVDGWNAASCVASAHPALCERRFLPGVLTIPPCATRKDLRLRWSGFPVGPSRVDLGFGKGIRVSNIRPTYDPASQIGEVLFDVKADCDLPGGPRDATLVFGGRRLSGEGVVDVLCPAVDNEPPQIEAPDVTLATCRPQEQAVTLAPPVVTDACGDPSSVVVTGRLLKVHGVELPYVVPVDPEDPEVVLPVGEAEILWFAIDEAGNSDFVVQRVTVEHRAGRECCELGMTVLEGTDSPDNLSGAGSVDHCVLGKGGADNMLTFGGEDFHSGGAEGDNIQLGNGSDLCVGGEGSDDIQAGYFGTQGDAIFGDAGGDSVTGSVGPDVVYGGAGADVLNTGSGVDSAVPGPGADVVHMGSGNDFLVVYDICELASGELFAGDGGQDTLVVPVANVASYGVSVQSFETVIVNPNQRHLSECFGT